MSAAEERWRREALLPWAQTFMLSLGSVCSRPDEAVLLREIQERLDKLLPDNGAAFAGGLSASGSMCGDEEEAYKRTAMKHVMTEPDPDVRRVRRLSVDRASILAHLESQLPPEAVGATPPPVKESAPRSEAVPTTLSSEESPPSAVGGAVRMTDDALGGCAPQVEDEKEPEPRSSLPPIQGASKRPNLPPLVVQMTSAPPDLEPEPDATSVEAPEEEEDESSSDDGDDKYSSVSRRKIEGEAELKLLALTSPSRGSRKMMSPNSMQRGAGSVRDLIMGSGGGSGSAKLQKRGGNNDAVPLRVRRFSSKLKVAEPRSSRLFPPAPLPPDSPGDGVFRSPRSRNAGKSTLSKVSASLRDSMMVPVTSASSCRYLLLDWCSNVWAWVRWGVLTCLAAVVYPFLRLQEMRSDTLADHAAKRKQAAALALMANGSVVSKGVMIPGSILVKTWEYVVLMAIMCVVVTAPLRLGFELWGDEWFPFDVVVDSIFAIDIVMSMNTALQDPDSDQLVAERRKILAAYFTGGAFLIDFVSAFPYWAVSDSKATKVFMLLKPLRLTRVSFITKRSSTTGSSTKLMTVLKIAVFGGLTHLLGCTYWYIANYEDVDAGSEWLPNPNFYSLRDHYADAIYWTLKSTLKSGPQPETYTQYVFTIVVMLLGEVLKAFLIGSITEILTSINMAQAEKKAQLDNVTTFLSRRRVDADLRNRILEFFNYRWSVGYSVQEHEQLLGQLPAQLSLELSLELKRTLIDKVPMFQNLASDTVVAIAECLRATLAVPDELIVVQGVTGSGMYYVNRGVVRIEYTPEDMSDAMEVMTMGVGSSFGEDSLVTRKARIATVRALTFCDMQRLSYRSYKRIAATSPALKKAVEVAAREKSVVVQALSRSTKMLKKMGNGAGVSNVVSPRKKGRFTMIAAKAVHAVDALRSPTNEGDRLSARRAGNESASNSAKSPAQLAKTPIAARRGAAQVLSRSAANSAAPSRNNSSSGFPGSPDPDRSPPSM